MRIMTYICSIIFLVSQPIWADNASSHHQYPGAKTSTPPLQSSIKPGAPGYYDSCNVEIMNDSFSDITVYGRYDDGVPVTPFNIYRYEYSHYVDLFYPDLLDMWRCHSGVYLSIVTLYGGYPIFSGYVFVGSIVHVVPSLAGKMKVEIQKPGA